MQAPRWVEKNIDLEKYREKYVFRLSAHSIMRKRAFQPLNSRKRCLFLFDNPILQDTNPPIDANNYIT